MKNPVENTTLLIFFLKKVQAIKNMQTISETATCFKGLFWPPYEAKI